MCIRDRDVALAIIGAVFECGYVNNKVMEFVGPGVANLSADFRIGIDVMTTETTCLSSIWKTDDTIKEFYEIHGREKDYKELNPGAVAYYDGMVEVDLSKIKPMIAMPFHPSNTYTIEEVNANLKDVLAEVEKRALVSLDGAVDLSLIHILITGTIPMMAANGESDVWGLSLIHILPFDHSGCIYPNERGRQKKRAGIRTIRERH